MIFRAWQAILTVVIMGFPEVQSDIACTRLYAAQYCCTRAVINLYTQQAENCTRANTALVPCFARQGVRCDGKVRGWIM